MNACCANALAKQKLAALNFGKSGVLRGHKKGRILTRARVNGGQGRLSALVKMADGGARTTLKRNWHITEECSHLHLPLKNQDGEQQGNNVKSQFNAECAWFAKECETAKWSTHCLRSIHAKPTGLTRMA